MIDVVFQKKKVKLNSDVMFSKKKKRKKGHRLKTKLLIFTMFLDIVDVMKKK